MRVSKFELPRVHINVTKSLVNERHVVVGLLDETSVTIGDALCAIFFENCLCLFKALKSFLVSVER